jgi:hypothetical protein
MMVSCKVEMTGTKFVVAFLSIITVQYFVVSEERRTGS